MHCPIWQSTATATAISGRGERRCRYIGRGNGATGQRNGAAFILRLRLRRDPAAGRPTTRSRGPQGAAQKWRGARLAAPRRYRVMSKSPGALPVSARDSHIVHSRRGWCEYALCAIGLSGLFVVFVSCVVRMCIVHRLRARQMASCCNRACYYRLGV